MANLIEESRVMELPQFMKDQIMLPKKGGQTGGYSVTELGNTTLKDFN
jgi:hypothetical protein